MEKSFFIVYRLKKILILSIVLLFAVAIISNPTIAISACKKSLGICGNVIIPSMFPFFVCSALLVNLGFASFLSRFLTPVMKPVFNVSGSGALAFTVGILSGYPIGASCVCNLREQNLCTKEEGERMLGFCTNSGPLFILGAVGVGMFHNYTIGMMLYAAHVLSALVVGIFLRFYKKNGTTKICTLVKDVKPRKTITTIICDCIKSSITSTLTICGFVIIFGVFISVFVDILVPQREMINAIFSGFFEVTEGAVRLTSISSLPLTQKILFASLIIGFAGLCVHFQIISIISKTDMSCKTYILGKVLCSIFSVVIMLILLRFVPLDLSVFSPYYASIPYIPQTFVQMMKVTFFYLSMGAFVMVSLYIITLIFGREDK